MSADARLWHLPTSQYSEKVRWALDCKRVPHVRRVPLAAPHVLVAAGLTRGRARTLPVLELNGRAHHDSTAILELLERRYPEPALFSEGDEQRRRATSIAAWFEHHAAVPVRTLVLYEVTQDPRALAKLAAAHIPAHMRAFPGAWTRTFGASITRLYGLNPEAAAAARAAARAAFERLERELDGSEHLVADRFTVADLTAASHLYWLVQPPEGPRIVDPLPPRLHEFVAPLRERPGFDWVLRTYRRHRGGDVGAAGAATAEPARSSAS